MPRQRAGQSSAALATLLSLVVTLCTAQDGQNSDVPTDILRINAGGGELLPPETPDVWRADETYFRGDTRVLQNPPLLNVSAQLKTQRSGVGLLGQWLYYVVPNVYNAVFEVTFHFIELEHTARNQRVFNVLVDDQLVIPNLDIYGRVGINAPLKISFELPLSGRTVFSFEGGVVGRPICSGIEIVRRDLVRTTTTATTTTTKAVIPASPSAVAAITDPDDYTMVYLLGECHSAVHGECWRKFGLCGGWGGGGRGGGKAWRAKV